MRNIIGGVFRFSLYAVIFFVLLVVAIAVSRSSFSAPLRFTLIANSDGTYDTKYPNGDKPPQGGLVDFTATTQSVAENAGTFTISVARTIGSTGAASVAVQVTGGTATSADYTAADLPATLSWTNGDSANKSVTVHVTNRGGVQGTRTLIVGFGTPTGALLGSAIQSQTINITDASGNSIKFHQSPGYIWPGNIVSGGGSQAAADLTFIANNCANSFIKGYRFVIYWAAYEGPTLGDYSKGHTLLDNYINAAAACGQRVGLMFNISGFNSQYTTQPSINQAAGHTPQYMVSSTYGPCCTGTASNNWTMGAAVLPVGGTTPPNAGGTIQIAERIDTQIVADRWIAMIADIGARYDGNPNFEMLTPVNETILDSKLISFAGLSTQYARMIVAAQSALPHTMLVINANFMGTDTQMKTLFENCVASTNCILGSSDPNGPAVQFGITTDASHGQAPSIYNGSRCNGCTPRDYRPLVGWIGETQWVYLGQQPYMAGSGSLPTNCATSVSRIRSGYEGSLINAKSLVWDAVVPSCYTATGGIRDSITATPTITSTICPANWLGCDTSH